jgi:hypothetical protein
MTRFAFQTAMRAAAVQLLTDFKADTGLTLQIYRGRPKSIYPPCAFIDIIDEDIDASMNNLNHREVTVTVFVVHGLFDSGDTVDQRDAFVDGYIEWATDHKDQAGGQTLIAVGPTNDIPSYVPEWIQDNQRAYYASQITLRGTAYG